MSAIESGHDSDSDVTRNMISRTRQIRTLTYTMEKTERIRGDMITQVNDVKILREPYKVYSRQKYPNAGIEVLFVEGMHHGKAIVNPNGFPWVNLKLDPNGKIMRKNQHHSILHSGYDHVASILEYLLDKYGHSCGEMMQISGTEHHQGVPCWKIDFHNPHFKFIEYEVKKGETVLTIAQRYRLSEYMILENNPDVRHYRDVSEGQVIAIPNDYCKTMTVYIEKERNIPLFFQIGDHKGPYEAYAFSNLSIDEPVRPGEFTIGFEEYGF